MYRSRVIIYGVFGMAGCLLCLFFSLYAVYNEVNNSNWLGTVAFCGVAFLIVSALFILIRLISNQKRNIYGLFYNYELVTIGVFLLFLSGIIFSAARSAEGNVPIFIASSLVLAAFAFFIFRLRKKKI